MAYNNSITSGRPPLIWDDFRLALDQINENFTIIGSTLQGGDAKNISHVDKSNPVRIVTTTAHGLVNGQRFTITETGISQLDGNTYYANVSDNNDVLLYNDENLTIPTDGTLNDDYGSGGGRLQPLLNFTPIDFEAMTSNVSPNTTATYRLGQEDKTWKALYLSQTSDIIGEENNGLWIGTNQIKSVDGILDLPAGSTLAGELIIDPQNTFWKEIQVDGGESVVATTFADSLNLISGTKIRIDVDSSAESLIITNTGVTELLNGSGISISSATGDITVSNTGVLSLTNGSTLPAGLPSGSGISISSGTGDISITNTGVLDIQNGFGITVSRDDASGIVTVTNSAPAQVAYRTIAVAGQSSLVADSTSDTLIVEAGYGIIVTTSEVLDDTLTLAVDQNIDIIGSVFSDSSTMLVDGTGGKIVGDVETGRLRTSEGEIALGNFAGDTGQSPGAIAIGFAAGQDSQDAGAIAIGYSAGQTNQGISAVAVGYAAGTDSQSAATVAVGYGAGSTNQGYASVAIGYIAGSLNQPANSIIINASGVGLNGTASGFYVDPVRNVSTGTTLVYDVANKEIGYSESITGNFTGSVFSDNSQLLVDGIDAVLRADIVKSGDLHLTADDQQWTFDTNGGLTFPQGHKIFDNGILTGLVIRSNSSNDPIQLYNYGSDGNGLGSSRVEIKEDGIEIYTNYNGGSGQYQWRFADNGAIYFPDGSVQLSAGGAGGGAITAVGGGFKIADDSSTQVFVDVGETIQFVGTNGITCTVDAEGKITIDSGYKDISGNGFDFNSGTLATTVISTGTVEINGAASSQVYIGGGTTGSTSGNVNLGNGTNSIVFNSATSGISYTDLDDLPNGLGDVTVTGTEFDSTDSSAISFVPAVVLNSDLTVENDIIANHDVTVANNLTVLGNIVSQGSGTPEIFSDNEIYLTANTKVEVTSSPFKLASLSTADRDTFTPENGFIIFNSTTGALQAYQGGSWQDVSVGGVGNWIISGNIATSTDSSALVFGTNVEFNSAISVNQDVTVGGNLSVERIAGSVEFLDKSIFTQTYDKLVLLSGATGTVAHDLSLGSVFYHRSAAGNFTANITNADASKLRSLSLVIMLEQGGTAYLPTAVQIGGVAQTIKWLNATGLPTGNANQIDIVSINLIRTDSASWQVLASLSTYG